MDREAMSAVGTFDRRQWLAVVAISLGALMIVLDGTIVYVALPQIRAALRLNDKSLVWVTNSYVLTYSGCLLLGGRLADLWGRRRVFLTGTAVFTLASLACGLAAIPDVLMVGRGVQGIGGALVVAAALSLLLNTFPTDAERARVAGLFGFVSVGGSTIGFMLGGVITSMLNWHWIFLVNLPVGGAVFLFVLRLFPTDEINARDSKVDFWGAGTMMASLMFASYTIMSKRQADETAVPWVALAIVAASLFALFLTIEGRVRSPLVPLDIFRRRNFALAILVGFLVGMGTSSLFFVGLYVQVILGRGPMQAGLAFLPMSATAAAFSLGLSARIVTRCGVRRPLSIGLWVAAAGLGLLARVPLDGSLAADVVPSTILLGIGMGMTGSALLVAVTQDAFPGQSGLTSGVFSTTSLIGNMFGLASLAVLSNGRAEDSLASGLSPSVALAQGYRVALLGGAACVSLAALVAGLCLNMVRRSSAQVAVPRASERA